MKRLHLPLWRPVALVMLAGAQAGPALAEGTRRVPLDATYVQECGSCHAPYPPGLLSPDSWRQVLQGLRRHYGTDASLEPAALATLGDWLPAHGNPRRSEAPPDLRITRSRWFVREHDEVPADAWRRPAVRSAANCGACHPGAQAGNYDEHAVRIPR